MSNGSPAPKDLWRAADCLLDGLAQSVGARPGARLGGEKQDFDPERSAIMEVDGGLSRDLAEQFARDLLALGPNPSPDAIAALDNRLLAAQPAPELQKSKGRR